MEQQLGDLDRVQRRAFAEVVADDEERERVLARILANSAHENLVRARRFGRSRELFDPGRKRMSWSARAFQRHLVRGAALLAASGVAVQTVDSDDKSREDVWLRAKLRLRVEESGSHDRRLETTHGGDYPPMASAFGYAGAKSAAALTQLGRCSSPCRRSPPFTDESPRLQTALETVAGLIGVLVAGPLLLTLPLQPPSDYLLLVGALGVFAFANLSLSALRSSLSATARSQTFTTWALLGGRLLTAALLNRSRVDSPRG